MRYPELILSLPEWVDKVIGEGDRVFGTVQERMGLAIKLSRSNIEQGTGGPFGACVFEQESGKLISCGVNIVLSSHCSVGHAEIVAIGIAQQLLGGHDLSNEPKRSLELVTSSEPCAMCLGAIGWSGVRRVVCGARDEDVRSIGFDEGTKPADWVGALEGRGISVVQDVLREDAKAVLLQYKESGGIIYNARSVKRDA
jgi:tRNA(Arg) A34 adenosine deaminase TadA